MMQAALAAVPAGFGAGGSPAAESVPAGATLGAIRGVTITAGDLAAVEQAWTRFMGYRVVQRGSVSAATAASWGAPAVAGQRVLILGPESGEPTFLRFVEQPMPDGYSPAGSFGWSTTEITVQNADTLYARLKSSPFKITGPPRLVPTYSYLRAMQAEGPAGEKLNLTWITETRPDLAVAKSFVGRCFIVVQGGPDLPASLKFYQDVFGNESSPIRDLPTIKLAVVKLDDGAKIEIDQYPAAAKPRMRPPGGLPPGVALVTFDCTAFDRQQARFLTPPIEADLEPRRGHRAATLVGPSGELIELIQT
jgi:catechol 2,3-dioxygenase-like lactoylglutathione lyase family enzyme